MFNRSEPPEVLVVNPPQPQINSRRNLSMIDKNSEIIASELRLSDIQLLTLAQ